MKKIKQFEIEHLPIEELKPYRLNAKLHPQEQIKKIIRSIELTGFDQPIVVNKKDYSIVKGHGRLEAAIQMGMVTVPVILLDVSQDVADKARLLDNKSAEGEYDIEKLLKELTRFQDDIDATGYGREELDKLLVELESQTVGIEVVESKEPAEDDYIKVGLGVGEEKKKDFDSEHEDDVPEETEVETRVKTGDIWQLGDHFILCGDCTIERNVEELLGSVKVDMVFTDPPYGINTSIANDNLSEKELVDFNLKWSKVAFDILKDNSVLVCFHSTRLFWTALDSLRQKGFRFLRYLTLYKPNDCTFPWHRWILKSESILLFEKGKGSFEKIEPYYHDTLTHVHGKEQQEDRGGHPCCKPTGFIADFIKSFSGKIVFDFFLGSGTTLIACERTNRVCYGTELSEKYCDVIVTRWEKLTGMTAVLVRNINK